MKNVCTHVLIALKINENAHNTHLSDAFARNQMHKPLHNLAQALFGWG